MTVELGMFTMPFTIRIGTSRHPRGDQEAIVLAEPAGFTEAFVGEHFSSWSERITSPLIFFATLIPRTTQIRFGTGVINLPQLHPATVAAHAAMFDQLCKGRFIMGIGPGGLVSDLEMFERGPGRAAPADGHRVHRDRAQAVGQDPPYEIRPAALEDLAEERHLARVQGRHRAAPLPAAAPAHRAVPAHAQLQQRGHRG